MTLIIFISIVLNTILSYFVSESGNSREIGGFTSFVISFFFGFFIGVLITISSPLKKTPLLEKEENIKRISNFIIVSMSILALVSFLSIFSSPKESVDSTEYTNYSSSYNSYKINGNFNREMDDSTSKEIKDSYNWEIEKNLTEEEILAKDKEAVLKLLSNRKK